MNRASVRPFGTRQPSASDCRPRKLPHVLMIDDDVVALDVFGRFFAADGFDVSLAATGRAGLSRAADGGVDVLVLDLYLPDMSGLAVLAELRQAGRAVPAVVVSGLGTLEEAAAAMKLGASDVLSKPLDGDDLVAVVRSLVRPVVVGEDPTEPGAEDPALTANSVARDEILFAKAQVAIDAHLARPDLNLGAVASMLDVSRWRLSRVLSACGSDFRTAVRRARMQAAESRLRRPDAASVKEVAFDTGYRHHSDFTRHFKAFWGITPSAFREQHQRDRTDA